MEKVFFSQARPTRPLLPIIIFLLLVFTPFSWQKKENKKLGRAREYLKSGKIDEEQARVAVAGGGDGGGKSLRGSLNA